MVLSSKVVVPRTKKVIRVGKIERATNLTWHDVKVLHNINYHDKRINCRIKCKMCCCRPLSELMIL